MCLINILELLQITPHLLDVNIFTMLIAMYNYNLSLFAYSAEGSPPTYMNRRCDWLLQTIKDNKTIEMKFLKNES